MEIQVLKVMVENLPKNTRTPFLSHARKLLKDGYPDDTKVEFYRKGKDQPDVILNSIGWSALWTVLEDRHLGPRFVKYREYRDKYPDEN